MFKFPTIADFLALEPGLRLQNSASVGHLQVNSGPWHFPSCSRIARGIPRRRRRSQRKERLRSLLLRAAARDSRRSQLQCGRMAR
jgi:hypothetical protein